MGISNAVSGRPSQTPPDLSNAHRLTTLRPMAKKATSFAPERTADSREILDEQVGKRPA